MGMKGNKEKPSCLSCKDDCPCQRFEESGEYCQCGMNFDGTCYCCSITKYPDGELKNLNRYPNKKGVE